MFSLPLLEVARFRRTLLTRIALCIIVIIPVFYGGVYIAANWDPTGQLHNLTAAVVNDDKPADVTTASGTTEQLAAGDALEKQLLDSKDAGFTWKSMGEKEAKERLDDGSIAAVMTIPSTLSSSLASLGASDPERAKLVIQTDDANNYITGNIGKTVLTSVRDGLNSSTISNYLDNVYLGFNTLHDSISKASDGAKQLADGSGQVKTGTSSLSDGLNALNDGAGKLNAGAGKLLTGAQDAASGSHSLADGASQVADGTGKLASAADDVYNRAQHAQTRIDTFLDNTEQPSKTLANDIANGRDQVAGALQAQVAALAARYPDDADVQALKAQLETVESTLTPAADTAARINTNVDSIRSDVRDAVAGVVSTIQTVDSQVDALDAGAKQVSGGAQSLSTGLDTLQTGAQSLATGAGEVATGASSASDGGNRLKTATDQLAQGASSLSKGLADGLEQIPTYNAADRKIRTAVVSTPVIADAVRDNAVSAYGEGLAPYFIAIALWIGGMITYQILRAAPSRAYASPASSLRIAMAGYWPGIIFATLQAVALSAVLVFWLGVNPPNVLAFTGFILLTALAFTAMHQALVAYFGGVGRLFALVILVFQLASAGGTYPVETAPPFFQAISPYLPLTYAVRGTRALIAGGDPFAVWQSVIVLLITILGALLVSTIAAHKKRLWSITRLHPSLSV